MLHQLALDLGGVGRREIALVDGHDEGNLGAADLLDRLDRGRHDAVVRGDDQDHDVGELGPALAHGRERRVARGVDDDHGSDGGLDPVGAHVLGDTAGLTRGDLGLAQAIEERGLAVIDVAHHGDHRGPELPGDLDLAVLDELGFVEGHIFDPVAELVGDQLGGLEVEIAVEGRAADPHAPEDADDLGRLDAHLLGELADGDDLVDPNALLVGAHLLRAGAGRPTRAPYGAPPGHAPHRADLPGLAGAGPALGVVGPGGSLEHDLALGSSALVSACPWLGLGFGLGFGLGLDLDATEDLGTRATGSDDHAVCVANHPCAGSKLGRHRILRILRGGCGRGCRVGLGRALFRIARGFGTGGHERGLRPQLGLSACLRSMLRYATRAGHARPGGERGGTLSPR